MAAVAVFGRGSPPRAWGQRAIALLAVIGLLVHPHARGDNRLLRIRRAALIGSPPRAWGQRVCRSNGAGRGRFTPTRVGTTCCCASVPTIPTVHPHARGDNLAGR